MPSKKISDDSEIARARTLHPAMLARPSMMMRRRLVPGLRRFMQKEYQGKFLTRPRMEEVVLVRHGESEGNVAFNRSMAGDHSLYAGQFLERHSSFWRLTDRGRAQAMTTGAWMSENIGSEFDGHFTSEYLRAMETASLLALPDARWKPEVMLRERDWGEYDLASQHERRVAYRRYEARRRRESLFWAPPGGESLAQVVQRVDSVLLFANRRYSGGRVAFVCHGELMWAFRLRFERLTHVRYREMQAAPTVSERIHNCQVLQYSRRDPTTGELADDFQWRRTVCPWDLSLSGDNGWRPIDRSGGLTDSELLTAVERHPRLYNDEEQAVPRFSGDPEQGLACVGEPIDASTLRVLPAAAATATGESGAASEGAASAGAASADDFLSHCFMNSACMTIGTRGGAGGARDGRRRLVAEEREARHRAPRARAQVARRRPGRSASCRLVAPALRLLAGSA